MTFSLALRDPDNGDIAVAACTGVPAVGMACPFARGGVGAVATQALANPYLGPLILKALTTGRSPDQAIGDALVHDPHARRGERQVHVVDCLGRTAAYTGERCEDWSGHHTEQDLSAAGNLLAGPQVLEAMVASVGQTSGQRLAMRLVKALQAALDAGGDIRGHQSAALLVVGQGMPRLRLHVEMHDEPTVELRRLVENTTEIEDYMVDYVETHLHVPLG